MSTPNAPNQLSFLPEDYLERKARRRANILCGGLFAVCLGVGGGTFWMNEKLNARVDARYADVEAQYNQAAAKIAQVSQLHDKQKKIVQHAELAAALVERVPRSNILAEFTNALPPGASLLDLVMESKPRQAPAPAPGTTAFDQKKAALEGKAKGPPEPQAMDVYLRITGVADNDVQVSQFISKLNVSKLMKDVNLVQSELYQQDKAAMRKFQIEMYLNPEAEVREAPAAATAAAAPAPPPAAGKAGAKVASTGEEK